MPRMTLQEFDKAVIKNQIKEGRVYTSAEVRAAWRLNEVDAAIGPDMANDNEPCNEWGGYGVNTPWASVLENELQTIDDNGLDRARVIACQRWLKEAVR